MQPETTPNAKRARLLPALPFVFLGIWVYRQSSPAENAPHPRRELTEFDRSKLVTTSVMTCHLGYTLQHATLILLYLAALSCFLAASQRTAAHVRIIMSAFSVIAVLYHTFLGAVCSSASVSVAVHAYWPYPIAGVRLVFYWTLALFTAAIASHCISKGSGRSDLISYFGCRS